MNIILASSSPSRKKQLNQLKIPHMAISPDIDETPKPFERAFDLVQRLAFEKAEVIAKQHPNALVIGGDQVGEFGHQILGKPLTHEKAVEDLAALSGQSCTFYTGVCVWNAHTQQVHVDCAMTHLKFKQLTQDEIEHYLRQDQPYHCAGGFQIDGLGLALFESIQADDPSSIIGLPLMRLANLLKKEGYSVI